MVCLSRSLYDHLNKNLELHEVGNGPSSYVPSKSLSSCCLFFGHHLHILHNFEDRFAKVDLHFEFGDHLFIINDIFFSFISYAYSIANFSLTDQSLASSLILSSSFLLSHSWQPWGGIQWPRLKPWWFAPSIHMSDLVGQSPLVPHATSW